MRLICPDCTAQYEIDAAAIPAAGRDVQCSGCGRIWFQPAPEILLTQNAPPARRPKTPPHTAKPPKGRSTLSALISPRSEAPPPPRRRIDDSLLAILREEADREATARRADHGPEHAAPDPDDTSADEAARRVQVKLASSGAQALPQTNAAPVTTGDAPPAPTFDAPRPPATAATPEPAPTVQTLRPEPVPEPAPEPVAPRIEPMRLLVRHARLPDADEFDQRPQPVPPPPALPRYKQRRADHKSSSIYGFWFGFGLITALVVISMGLYLAGPVLAQKLPALAPALVAYAEFIDGLRFGH
ncbi:hypothetical protein ERN12_10535 [Rhodobacteraceae bacterium]|nr:hypothetical protein ERN12_10535 [Paracoccaceae bacterium]